MKKKKKLLLGALLERSDIEQMRHTRDSQGLGFQATVLNSFSVISCLLVSGCVKSLRLFLRGDRHQSAGLLLRSAP